MARPEVAATTLADFLDHLKRTAGRLIYGTDYVGTYVDIDAIMLGKAAGLPVACHLTNGAAAILAGLLAGESDLAMLNVATATANIGRYKPLAVTARARLAKFPGVPTMAEAGYPDIGTSNWQGLFAPRATPRGILLRLHRAALRAMDTPAAREAFAQVSATIATSETPEIFAAEIAAEMRRWEAMIPTMAALQQA
jgi:tripartite-type tricarboxylate transporter receptor subunit TctC